MALTNAEIKSLAVLHTKKGRKKENRFLAEGVRLLEEALAGNRRPRIVYYAPSQLTDRGMRVVERFGLKGVATKSISAKECHRLSDTETSQGLLAVFDMETKDLQQLLDKKPRKILICDRIGDPGNLGTLMRSAVAFGFDLMVTTDRTVEVYSPKTIRSSAGAFFRLTLFEGEEDGHLARMLEAGGYVIFYADIRGKEIDANWRFPEQFALVVGSEAFGAGDKLAEAARHHIRIPMAPQAESLNAAMAGTILMFWIAMMERR